MSKKPDLYNVIFDAPNEAVHELVGDALMAAVERGCSITAIIKHARSRACAADLDWVPDEIVEHLS